MCASWQVHHWYRGAKHTAYLKHIGADLWDFCRWDHSARKGRVTEVRRAKRANRREVKAEVIAGLQDYWAAKGPSTPKEQEALGIGTCEDCASSDAVDHDHVTLCHRCMDAYMDLCIERG